MRSLYLSLIALVFIALSGCSKEPSSTDDGDDTPSKRKKIEFIAFCNALANNSDTYFLNIKDLKLNGGDYYANHQEAEAQDYKTIMFTEDDVTYSFKVMEQTFVGGIINTKSNTYTGSIDYDDLSETSLNKIEVVQDGSSWKLKTSNSGSNGGGGNNGSKEGVWQRFNSPNGYQTDLAIGNIPGEPANRVYMCEHPGSPSAGLYKGYINGEIITWDAVHGIPDAKFYERDGVMRLWFTVGPEDDAGRYKKGTWTNTCGPLGGGGVTNPKIAVGLDPAELTGSIAIVSVTIEGKVCPITQLSASMPAPDCINGKYITAPTSSDPVYLKVKITYSGNGINGPYTKTDESVLLKSELISSCNRYKITAPAGRWLLQFM